MSVQDAAKILLEHGSFENYIFNEIEGPSIDSKSLLIRIDLITYFESIVDSVEIAEEVLENKGTEEDINNCMFKTWLEAWEHFRNDVILEVSKDILKSTNISENFISYIKEFVYNISENIDY